MDKLTRLAAAQVMHRPWTPEDEQRILDLRAKGLTWRVVAYKLGRTESSVVGHYLKHVKKEKSAEPK